jgi:histidinol-phosphate aminotransferase
VEPYVPGLSAEEIKERYHLEAVAKLGSNENPLGVSPRVRRALIEAIDRVHQYPDPECGSLRQLAAARLGVPPDHLFFANGVDNVLTCLGLAFLDAGDRCVVGTPTYTTYVALARLLDAVPVEVPLADWRFDVGAMAAASDGAKAVVVCNPNNPTGSIITHGEAEVLLARISGDTLVVMDEAYGEWADDPAFPDAVALLRRHRNLIVLRTFSKIYGLAGLRVGYAIADPGLVASMNQVREPFAVDRLAQAAAEAVLEDDEYRRAAFENNRSGREFLARAFTEMHLAHLPTQANFILVNLGQPAADVATRLLPKGVIIRPGGLWRLPTWARVSIGTPAENTRVVAALSETLAGT